MTTKPQAEYTPGLHILAEIHTSDTDLLKDANGFMAFIRRQVTDAGLHALGEVVHSFEGAGYTAVVCLTESHLSIHTWPEYGILTFDVFLSNYQKQNDEKCRSVYNEVLNYFKGSVISVKELSR